ncbi:uncharacterized protein A4U43_C05F26020 [Asparagus officinalis]|uniref:Uncharacterized protein n=1 Tax=Asparagus officinalis TaxID=4686 RepID=A0A5P1EZX9_ASPOF|nr:uncharacterized protein A4U43_C05F26020 [Asparagus officinalis]
MGIRRGKARRCAEVELYAEKVNNNGLCAIAHAESLRYKLLGGLPGSASRLERSRACFGRRGEEDVGDGEDLVGTVVGEPGIGVERSRACLVNWRRVGIQVQQATRLRVRLEEGGGGAEEGEGDGAAPKGDEGGVELMEGHLAKEDPLDAR